MTRLSPARPILALFIFAVVLVALAASPGLTLAARNPAGTGQPGVECGDEGAEQSPPGFATDGFANAEEMYAGSGASVAHAQSEHAVSQYDVACYQVTSHP